MDILNDFTGKFDVLDRNFAHTIFKNDFPDVYKSLHQYLTTFELYKSEIFKDGGNESAIPKKIKGHFKTLDWDDEKKFSISRSVDGQVNESSSYKIDLFNTSSKIALDIEWNSKDSVFNRDLSNFKILHEAQAINFAIIFTRTHEGIMELTKSLDDEYIKWRIKNKKSQKKLSSKYGASTTNMKKLREKLDLGILGSCPLIAIGIDSGAFNSKL